MTSEDDFEAFIKQYTYRRRYILHSSCSCNSSEQLRFFIIAIVGDRVHLGPLGTADTNDLLCRPRVIMMMEKLVEWLAGETEVLGENLPHMLLESEPGPPRCEAID
jgi:hypothetical protein